MRGALPELLLALEHGTSLTEDHRFSRAVPSEVGHQNEPYCFTTSFATLSPVELIPGIV